ncbi:MAG: S8 family serine peptidase [Chloroflexi bacterium]|nr:S8 family serine peptidase [Chloroflexota bacterium]MCI0728175.1 S8 family serine peptidase [Chloroflexota bacterium]
MTHLTPCPGCQTPTDPAVLAEASQYAFWRKPDGACPACVQQQLLQELLKKGDEALHQGVQAAWPLDAGAAFGVLPTPLRLHADPRFAGRGVTLALVDSGFYPHPDLVQPRNRIRAWVDAGREPVRVRRFTPEKTPRWPGWDSRRGWQWHGLMTSVVAAGNGFLSHSLYRGLASEADVVLVQARDSSGAITNETISRALRWLLAHASELDLRVASLSVAGDLVWPPALNPVDRAVADLVAAGVVVVAAAGNDGVRRLVPPATAPQALTIGGIDDHNLLDHEQIALWHSNYGLSSGGRLKPELVAPSIWLAAPVLPGTAVAAEAQRLFATRTGAGRASSGAIAEDRIAELKLITPYYQHVDGTSFAAPLVASTVACLLEARPSLAPQLVRDVLQASAHPVPGVGRERQGAGALEAGRAVALALREMHRQVQPSPQVSPAGVSFSLHDHQAHQVQVFGEWDGWRAPGLVARQMDKGVWQTEERPIPPGRYGYKFLLDGTRWLDDPDNPVKAPDGFGGLNALLNVPAG